MSEPVEIALITSILPVIATVISALIAWAVSRNAAKKINEIHLIVNSQRSEMMLEIQSQAEQIRKLKNTIEGFDRPAR
jgi:P pilus assembly chaperone PapD